MGSFLAGGGSVLNHFEYATAKEAQGGENNPNLVNLWAYQGGGNDDYTFAGAGWFLGGMLSTQAVVIV